MEIFFQFSLPYYGGWQDNRPDRRFSAATPRSGQPKTTGALIRALSWSGSLETLIQKRDDFVTSLLK